MISGASVERTTRCWCTSWGTGRSALARPSSPRCMSSSTPAPVRRLAFEAQALAAWDTRLLTFLRQVLEASTHRQIVVDQQGLRRASAASWHWPPPCPSAKAPGAGGPDSPGLPASGRRCSLPGRAPGPCWASLARPSSPASGWRPARPLPARRSGPLRAGKRRAGPGYCQPH